VAIRKFGSKIQETKINTMKLPTDTSIQSHQLTALGRCDAHI
jgi:hypothetical protein